MRVRLTREILNMSDMRDFNAWRYSVDAWLMLGWFVGWSLLEYCWAVGLILVVFFVLKKLYFLCSVLLRLTVWLWCQHWIVHLGDHLWPEPKPGCSLGPLEQLGRLLPPPVLPIFHCWALGILHGVDSTCIIRRKVFVEVFIFYFNFIFISFDVFFCIAVWCSVRGARCRRMSRVRSGESQWCRGRTLRTLEADNPNPNGTWCMAHGGRFMAGHIWNHMNVTSKYFIPSEFYAMFE